MQQRVALALSLLTDAKHAALASLLQEHVSPECIERVAQAALGTCGSSKLPPTQLARLPWVQVAFLVPSLHSMVAPLVRPVQVPAAATSASVMANTTQPADIAQYDHLPGIQRPILKCPYCAQCGLTRTQYMMQMTAHMGYALFESFPCFECGQRFRSKPELCAHVRGDHMYSNRWPARTAPPVWYGTTCERPWQGARWRHL